MQRGGWHLESNLGTNIAACFSHQMPPFGSYSFTYFVPSHHLAAMETQPMSTAPHSLSGK